MSSPRIGEEFEKAISGKKDRKTEGFERPPDILSFLSRNPCSTSTAIARALGISERGVMWHLRAMKRLEFVAEMDINSKKRFFIKMHVREEDCEVLSLIKQPTVRKIFMDVLENPGIRQKALSKNVKISRQSMSKILKKLMEKGILTGTRDGRNMRYYPTKKLQELQRIYEERRESVSRRIREIVRAMGMEYEITMDRDGLLYMKIGNRELRFGTDPIRSIMEE